MFRAATDDRPDLLESGISLAGKRMRKVVGVGAPLRGTAIAPTAIPGIDFAAVATPLAEIPEIGPISNRETAAPAGPGPARATAGTGRTSSASSATGTARGPCRAGRPSPRPSATPFRIFRSADDRFGKTPSGVCRETHPGAPEPLGCCPDLSNSR